MIQAMFLVEIDNEQESAKVVLELIRNLTPFITKTEIASNEKYWKIDSVFRVTCNLETSQRIDFSIADILLRRISDNWSWDEAKTHPVTDKRWAKIINPKLNFASFWFEDLEIEYQNGLDRLKKEQGKDK